MNIQSILNINTVTLNKNTDYFKQKEKLNQTQSLTKNVDLNDIPAGMINRSYVLFRGRFHNKYSYLFSNYNKIYNSKTEEVLPKRFYTGYAGKEIYLSDASASAPLNQKNAWKLFSQEVFENFLKKNPDLSSILYNSQIAKTFKDYGIDLNLKQIRDTVLNNEENDELKSLFDFTRALKEKYNIDILKESTYYRFIGKGELVKLLKGEKIVKEFPLTMFDITTNPELNWNHFRVTFKNNEAFTDILQTHNKNSMVRENDAETYRYYLKRPYSLDDIEKIEMASPHGLLKFDLKHLFTDEELDAIDTLMFLY